MLDSYLSTVDRAWPTTIANLTSRLHPVDRDATRIWFSLYPLMLHERAIATRDQGAFELFYQLRGTYRLRDSVHISHRFLYGHRYWPLARLAAIEGTPQPTLEETILSVARHIEAPESLAIGMAAIALMTLRQAPAELRQSAPPHANSPAADLPETRLANRAKDADAGWFGRLAGKPHGPRIIFNEADPAAAFPLHPTQDITMAASADHRPYHLTDSRCFEDMGPIPVECRSGSCGTCWIGVLGGNQNLSAVTPYERKRMEYLGYWDAGFEDPQAERPLIRLACQTQASGSASIVIPPWCGVFGLTRREREPGKA